jgi:hypothetical protein
MNEWMGRTARFFKQGLMVASLAVLAACGSSGSSEPEPAPPPAAVVPTISAAPAAVALTAGQAATFSVTATGTAPFAYQWQREGVNITGATAATYSITAPTVADNGAKFQVVITNAAGSVTSAAAVLTVTAAAPTITTQPQSVTGVDGSTVSLSVAATGTGPLSYQWQKNGSNIANATQTSYATPPLTPADTGTAYSVVVTNGGGSITSASAVLTVNYLAVAITSQPAAVSVAQGATATFNAAATGSAPISYQWRKNGTAITGATAASYTTPATAAADDGALFTAVLTNPAGSVTTNAAKLTVNVGAVVPTIATAPASVTVSEGQVATFTTTAAGTAPFTYQWRRNGVDIASATAVSYTTAATVVADNAARFSVRVTNAAGTVTSAEAVLTVQSAASGLVGRNWAPGQLLETDDNVVRDRDYAIDDAGRVMVVFRKSNGSRDVLYVTRGTPNQSGQAAVWTTPVAIDLLAGAPVSTMSTVDYGLVMSPNGNALVYWYHSALCSITTYNVSGNCRYYYLARFTAASGTWSAPELIGDVPSPSFKVFFNDRGDIAMLGTGWVRTGTSGYASSRTLYMRNPAETSFRKQLLNDPAIGSNILNLDGSGNLLLASEYSQNSTTDIVAFRGTVAGGLGPFQILDTRGAAATLKLSTVGINGQQAVIWSQNNGTISTTYGATAAAAASPFTVVDLGFQIDSSLTLLTLVASDDGVIRYYEVGFFGSGRKRSQWTAATGWSAPVAMPSELYAYDTVVTRSGDILGVRSGGAWVTFDGSRNVIVQSFNTSPAYVLGFSKSYTGGGPVLAVNGVGFADIFDKFDTLPTPAVPAGDGRNIVNLWGVFLK